MSQSKKNTYCHRLWDEIFINEWGNIYSCCHQRPGKFGNIKNIKLIDIVNCDKIKNYREKSLKGKLHCFKHCNLLHKREILNLKSSSIIDYSELKRIKISFGQGCNINCIMCWQNSKSKRNLDYKKIAENVDITPFESIEIQGGEPLFIPSAKKFFDYIASKGKKVSLLTNGTLINKKWAEKIALHSDFINISLNAATKQTHEFINRGSRWESVLNNIQKLHNAREVLKTNLLIYGHMTIVRQNLMEISMFIERFRDFGFDTIEFGVDFRVPFYLKLHPKKKRIIHLNVKEALEKCKDKYLVDTLRLQKLGIA